MATGPTGRATAAAPAGAGAAGRRATRAETTSAAGTNSPAARAVLDGPVWHEIGPVTDFRRRVPVAGAPSSERAELRVAFDDISLPVDDGDFTTRLVGVTVLGAVSRSLFANALVQYDDVSDVVRANVRINWIHAPGSDLFVVFDTGYLTGDLLDPRTERWRRRTGVVKPTYLKAF